MAIYAESSRNLYQDVGEFRLVVASQAIHPYTVWCRIVAPYCPVRRRSHFISRKIWQVWYTISIRPLAEDDLLQIRSEDARAGVAIAHWLQSIQEDQNRLDRLTQNGFQDDQLDVAEIQALQRHGINGWRVKLASDKESEAWLPYRVLYAFELRQGRGIYHVLRVARRGRGPGFDYRLDDSVIRSCLDEIDRLGLSGPRGARNRRR